MKQAVGLRGAAPGGLSQLGTDSWFRLSSGSQGRGPEPGAPCSAPNLLER